MRIVNSLENLSLNHKTAVALGNFDGIHLGHREIMENAVKEASARGLESLCFTFSNSPYNFIIGKKPGEPGAAGIICDEDEKTELIGNLGFDTLVNVPFDEHIMNMSAHDFFTDILVRKLNAGHISVGFNYSYGAGAGGGPETLRVECNKAGISINVRDAVKVDGRVVSSTLIREKINCGDMESVRKYLGRPLSFRGRVAHGNRIGRTGGYPTANILPAAGKMLPPFGVYFSRILIDGNMYIGVSNIGIKPSIKRKTDGGEPAVSIETNLFDFSGDIYGRDIIVFFDHFSRRERKFDSKEELFAQIARDSEGSRRYYQK